MITCRVCGVTANNKNEQVSFKRNHPQADALTPSGREIYHCGDKLVSYVLVDGVVILMSPQEIHDKYNERQA